MNLQITMTGYTAAMRRYVDFAGRSSRAEFWAFFNVYFVLTVVAMFMDASIGGKADGLGGIALIVQLAHLLPGFAITARRMHDLDRTGWWVLLGLTGVGWIVLLVMGNAAGAKIADRFGPPPWAAPSQRSGETGNPSGRSAPAAQPAAPVQRDTVGEIERLAKLFEAGSLSEAEFTVLKAQALGGARQS